MKNKRSTPKSRAGSTPRQRALRWLTNKYVIVFAVFAVYITFFDHYSLVKQHELNQTLADLERERVQYARTIQEARELQATIDADEERFARERYYMKRADEDVYIVE